MNGQKLLHNKVVLNSIPTLAFIQYHTTKHSITVPLPFVLLNCYHCPQNCQFDLGQQILGIYD